MTRKVINLALQGGGAHGAFTWGALDRLLEDDGIEIEGISATSAGAMNAAALKHGWIAGGNEGARERLEALWLKIAGLDAAMPDAIMDWLRAVSPAPSVTARALEASPAVLAGEVMTRMLSPYQFNPLNWNPLRGIVEEMLDYDRVCATQGPKLFIAATNVRSGKVRIFHGREITPDAIIASTSLPTLYQAVEMDDRDALLHQLCHAPPIMLGVFRDSGLTPIINKYTQNGDSPADIRTEAMMMIERFDLLYRTNGSRP